MLSALHPYPSKDSGFTLLELLIALVIVGALSAIALPSFFNQTAKARSTEAKATLGTINRMQQSYRYEEGGFAPDLVTLGNFGLNVPSNNYIYTVSGTPNTATASADTLQTDLKVYAAGIAFGIDSRFAQGICESINVKGNPPNNTATVAVSSGVSASVTCTTGNPID